MAASLFIPASEYVGGRWREARLAMGRKVALPFAAGERAAVLVTLPDTSLIARATEAPAVATYFSLRPAWLRLNFVVLAYLAALLRPLRRPLVWLLTRQLILVRAWLLREVETELELVAVCDRGLASERREGLAFEDGQGATAQGVCAFVEAWLRRDDRGRPFGVFGVGELFELDELRRYLELPGADDGPRSRGSAAQRLTSTSNTP